MQLNPELRNIIKQLLPEILRRKLAGLIYGWHGNYSSWGEALKRSTGYDEGIIFDKAESAARSVREGKAAYERDSFLFDKIDYSFPLLSILMWISARNGGKLNILDFGGSLGSTYLQHKMFLDSLREVNWCIVEQPEFVKRGINDFESDRLHFFHTMKECCESQHIDAVLFSSVLQYLEEPQKVLELVMSMNIKYIIVDRTPLVVGNDRITVQKVDPRIYRASYPCWFFNRSKFLSYFHPDYQKVLEFEAADRANVKSEFRGFLFSKIE